MMRVSIEFTNICDSINRDITDAIRMNTKDLMGDITDKVCNYLTDDEITSVQFEVESVFTEARANVSIDKRSK